MQWFLDVRDLMQENKKIRIVLSTAILVSIGFSWWAAAVQLQQDAPRTISAEQEKKIQFALAELEKQKISINMSCICNTSEANNYYDRWQQILVMGHGFWEIQGFTNYFSTNLHKGILVKSGKEYWDFIQKFVNELNDMGIEAKAELETKDAQDYSFAIIIGLKD